MATRRLEVVFVGDTKQLEGAFRRVGAEATGMGAGLARAGKKLSGFGEQMTRKVSVPLAAVGGVSAKLALDFDTSMSHIGTLVGASQKQIKQWSGQVLDLAKKLPQSPKELADALYFITSSGISGAHAMDVLRASARAAASGLGSTQTVADAVTSAINAYGEKNLSAARATDVLVGAVREGKGEPEELAAVFGRVIPLAEQMGVSFDQVGAGLAALSLTGNNAEESATQLSRVMATFLKPSNESAGALKRMGLSVQNVRDRIRKDGLLDAMLFLRKQTAKYGVDVADVFPNIRALRGFLSLTGKAAHKNAGIFKSLAGGTGDADEAFAKASKTVKFKLNSALSSLQVAGIKLGNAVLPVIVPLFEKFATVVGKLGDGFDGLPGPVKQFVVILGTALVAIGPVAWGMGKLLEASGLLIRVFMGLYKAARVLFLFIRLAPALLGPVGIAILAIGTIAVLVATHWKQTKAVLAAVWHFLKDAASKVFEAIGWAAQHGLLGPIPFIIANWKKIPGWLVGALKAAPRLLLDAGKWVVDTLIAGIKAMPAALGTAAGWLIGTYVSLMFKLYVQLPIKAGRWIVHRVVDGVKAIPGALADAAGWLVGRVVAFVHDGVGRVVGLGKWVVGKAADGIRSAPGAIGDAASWIVGKIVAFVHDAPGRLVGLGSWLVTKVLHGILSVPKLIVNAASSFVSHLIGAVKDKLGIHSPSREFFKIGLHVAQGLIGGMSAGDILGFATGHVGSFIKLVGALVKKGLIAPVSMIGGLIPGGDAAGFKHGQVLKWLGTALAITGHLTGPNLKALFGRTMQESSGNPRAINLTDSNARAGHPSKGLLQTIDSTFSRYRLGSLPNDIWNPIANAVAAIRYMYATYGHIVGPSSSGYAQGGMVRARVGELGPEDVYLPVGARVMQASQSGRSDGPLVNIEHAEFRSEADATLLGRELAWQIATR